jgi:GNAT superfamily N-acetyltransferase
MSAIQVRSFEISDVEKLIELFRDTVRKVNRKDYSEEQILAWAPDHIDFSRWKTRLLQSFTFVATIDAEPVGFSNLEPSGHVDLFYVHAGHQSRGVGRAMMLSTIEKAEALGIERLFSEVSITARPFFAYHGFQVDAEQTVTFRSAQFTNFRMSKRIFESDSFGKALQSSLDYLGSKEMIRSLESNTYWPKWNSPWWHMTLLHEMGLAKLIPDIAIRKMVDRLKQSPLTVFPIHAHEIPEGVDLSLGGHCHCALGNIYQALAGNGVDVDRELPWMRSWFLRYQLPDGGMNCDEAAYLKEPAPSSMVATISPLEAVLFHTPRTFTDEEIGFLDRGAKCLLDRQLMHATTSPHNLDERRDEADWLKLCFPRFYLYDVLRGLKFILHWASIRNQPIQKSSIGKTVRHLEMLYASGRIKIARQSYEGISTLLQSESWEWKRRQPATLFPLVTEVSVIGSVSPYLTQQWESARQLMASLEKSGLLQ